MTSKRVNTLLTIAIMLTTGLNAQFRHSAQLDTVKETGFYSISVTPELASYLKTDLSDLRIVDENKRPVPFIVEWPYEKRAITPGLYDEKITSKKTADYKTILIIENAEKVELSNFILELKTAAAERTGSLSGSENGNEWYAILDSLMLRSADEYSDTSRLQRINFPAGTYRYYRLTIYNNKKEPLNILNARTWSATIPLDSIPRFFKNPQPKYFQVDSAGYSLVTIVPEKSFQAGILQVNVARPWFYKRQIKLFTAMKNSVPATWHEIGFHTMNISSDDFSGYTIPLVKSDTLYMIIENGDNPPLQISSIATNLPNRNIIAHLEKGKSYSLLLDDPGAGAPVYDLEHFKDRIHAPKPLSISNITSLQPEALLAQKQTGRRWIWPVIILVILVLGALTWKLVSDMKKADTQ